MMQMMKSTHIGTYSKEKYNNCFKGFSVLEIAMHIFRVIYHGREAKLEA
jgi:hypothetical protein